MSEFLSELIGTMILVTLGCGVVGGVLLKKSKAENSGWIVITLGFGLAVALGVYAAKVSGGHINPAVTLGLASIGAFPWAKVPIYLSGQMLGAIIGGAIVYLNYLPHWKQTQDKGVKLGVFATGPAIQSPFSNFISEMIGTFMLVIGIMFIGANDLTEGLNPLLIGLLVSSIGMSLGGTTGFAINPARDLGPRIAHALLPIQGKGDSDWAYAWIPVFAAIVGGIYGAIFYKAVFDSNFTGGFWVSSILMALLLIGGAHTEMRNKKA